MMSYSLFLFLLVLATGTYGHFDDLPASEPTNGSKRAEREMHHLLRGKRPFVHYKRSQHFAEDEDPVLIQPLILTSSPRATRASMDHLFRGKRYQDVSSHFLRGRRSGADMNYLVRGRKSDGYGYDDQDPSYDLADY